MGDVPDVSVIISSYNTREMLRRCIDSVHVSVQSIDYELIVADDASPDGSADMVRQLYPNIQITESERNVGYVQVTNAGIRLSRGRYIVLLNADTELHPRALDEMVQFMDQTPDAGVCGAKLLNPDGSIQYCIRSFPSVSTVLAQSLGLHMLFPDNPITSRYYMKHLDHNKVIEAESIGTTCYMIRRETLEAVGLLDEQFVTYCSDLDYNKRIGIAGYKIYYLPQAKVTHYGGLSVNQNARWHLIDAHRGYRILYDRYYAPSHGPLYNTLVRMAIKVRLLLYLARHAISSDKRVVRGPGAPNLDTSCNKRNNIQ